MKKLENVQWKLTRFSVGVSLVVATVLLVVFLQYFQLNFQVFFSAKWFQLPFIVLLLLLILTIGTISGYIYGNFLKKRLEKLIESVLKFERGNFSHRVPPLGDDEIGLVAQHLNQMTTRLEQQVASLQKLATEKVEWEEQIKKSVILEERQRLARELHDAVSQQLFAISMLSSAVLENMKADNEGMKKQIELVERMAGNAQNEMRALLLHLRPPTLEGKGLKEALEELLSEFKAKQTLDIQWQLTEVPDLLKGIEDHLFRIVQEGLSNVFRHSQATSVTVRMAVVQQQLHLKIIDNGIGFDKSKSKKSSYGLQSIQERVNEIGGVAEVLSFPNKGTQIDVKIPIVVREGSGAI